MPPPSMLLDLHDDLLVQIASFFEDASRLLEPMLFVCRRFHRLMHPLYCLAILFGSEFDIPATVHDTMRAIEPLIEHYESDPKVAHLVRRRITRPIAIQMMDQILCGGGGGGRSPEIITRFVHLFQLRVFREMAPGIFHEWRRFSQPKKRPANLRIRFYNLFGVDFQKKQSIAIDLPPEFAALLRSVVENFPGPRPGQSWCHSYAREPLFHPDVIHLHECSRDLGPVFKLLLDRAGASEYLKDPDVLWELARIGFRIPIALYLSKIEFSAAQFRQVAPYLSPWQYQDQFHRALPRPELLPILLRLDPVRTSLMAPVLDQMHDFLKRAQYAEFAEIAKHVSWRFFEEDQFPGGLLRTALDMEAPRHVLDFLLDCPPERLQHCYSPEYEVDADTRAYVIEKIRSKFPPADSSSASALRTIQDNLGWDDGETSLELVPASKYSNPIA